MEGCPAGEQEARRCQMRLQSVITPMMKKPASYGTGIRVCCNLAHGIDCLVNEAFPLCDEGGERGPFICSQFTDAALPAAAHILVCSICVRESGAA